ncbi:MAG: PAS domain S-box protein, partial [Desulfobacteraceae bacterium]
MDEINSNRHWEQILSVINDGLMLVGPDGIIRKVNRAFEELTGFTSAEILGKPCTVLNCDGCEKALSEGGSYWCSLFENRDKVKKHCIIMRKDGSYMPILKAASLMKDKRGSPIAAIETMTDMSEYEKATQQLKQLSRQLDEEAGFMGLIGKSRSMQNVFNLMEKASQSDAPVIIQGESGTGKEMVALGIHQLGRRKEGPFIQINCAALNESLLESELFGHAKGAFTGAYRHRMGRFEAASGGDIFLDEIGDIPLSIQVKLLRVLETKKVERVGENRPITVDVRIITATHRNLAKLLEEKSFREDLFFRINVIPIYLPPLRERSEDIPILINSFIGRLNSVTGKCVTGLSRSAMESIMGYRWPGNVRELKSALEYAFVVAEGHIIGPEQLPSQVRGTTGGKTYARS